MRSSVDIQFSVRLIRIIPEPSFPSQGSQARGNEIGAYGAGSEPMELGSEPIELPPSL